MAVVWISKLTSGELTLHVPIQWKTPDGTNVTSRMFPEKAPDRTDSIHGRRFPGTAQSLPCISSSNSHCSYKCYHTGKRMYNDFGFDSISRLSRDSGSYWLLSLHSELVGTLWGTETLSSATDVSVMERGLKLTANYHLTLGHQTYLCYYCGAPVAP